LSSGKNEQKRRNITDVLSGIIQKVVKAYEYIIPVFISSLLVNCKALCEGHMGTIIGLSGSFSSKGMGRCPLF